MLALLGGRVTTQTEIELSRQQAWLKVMGVQMATADEAQKGKAALVERTEHKVFPLRGKPKSLTKSKFR
jgi:hypothetical protein